MIVVTLTALLLPARLPGADGDGSAKKWLTGRWAAASVATAVAAPEKKVGAQADSGGRVKNKVKTRTKRAVAKKSVDELPKFVIEFTKDGKIRFDGDPSTLGETFRFIKPLAMFPMKFAPQNKYIKITYQFTDDDTIEVSADHTWLMERLSAGGRGEISPEKAQELNREFHPHETLRVVASSKQLTLTDDRGKSLTFRRYTGEPLDVAEGKRREAEVRSGLKSLEGILKQQGINIGGPADGKPAGKNGPRP
jgi:hypothetical protein